MATRKPAIRRGGGGEGWLGGGRGPPLPPSPLEPGPALDEEAGAWSPQALSPRRECMLGAGRGGRVAELGEEGVLGDPEKSRRR